MRLTKALQLAVCGAVLCGLLSAGARADDYNNKTIVTFRDAVQIPGQVLAPGTYVFMLLNSPANRNVVEIWNADQKELLASLQTNSETDWPPPDRPIYTPDHPRFQLDEQGSGQPLLLRSFYFPSYLEGHDFIYGSNSH
jgi:hypothetical protein